MQSTPRSMPKNAKLENHKYAAKRLENGDTFKELFVKRHYALFKSPEKWTDIPMTAGKDIVRTLSGSKRKAYWLSQNLRTIFNRRSTEDGAWLNLVRWYNRVTDSVFKSFNTIATTFYEHSDNILNFFDNRPTNASAESINSKIKAFSAKLHDINDSGFFIFQLCNIHTQIQIYYYAPV